MKRIVLIATLAAAAVIVACQGKPAGRPAREARNGDEAEGRRSARRGRTAGRVSPRSRAEVRAETRAARKEERHRKREARRRERERRRQLRLARRDTRRSATGRRRSSRRGRRGQLYVVSAIVSLGDESYALVDGRRVAVGDVVMGRRIVEIRPDRVSVEAFGRRSTVRVGESIVPLTVSTGRSRRRR